MEVSVKVQIESGAKVSGLALENDAPRFRLTVPSGELRVEDCVTDTECSFFGGFTGVSKPKFRRGYRIEYYSPAPGQPHPLFDSTSVFYNRYLVCARLTGKDSVTTTTAELDLSGCGTRALPWRLPVGTTNSKGAPIGGTTSKYQAKSIAATPIESHWFCCCSTIRRSSSGNELRPASIHQRFSLTENTRDQGSEIEHLEKSESLRQLR